MTRQFLESGISASERERTAGLLSQAEAAVAAREFEEALGCLERAGLLSEEWEPALALRGLLAGATARSELGRVKEALALLERARDLVEGDLFTEIDRANVLFHMGQCRYRLSSIPTAVALFTEALDQMRRRPDRRSPAVAHPPLALRCHRRLSDWEAARATSKRRSSSPSCSTTATRSPTATSRPRSSRSATVQWVLARSHAELAKALYEEEDDRRNVGRLLNNLGGLTFLLGDPEKAVQLLTEAFAVALEVGSKPDAAQAVSSWLRSLAHRPGRARRGAGAAGADPARGEGRLPRRAGNAQLVLGRALLEQGRLDEAEQALAASEATFEQLSSTSHRAAAWTAQAELSIRRGDKDQALGLYRRAAETLQDFRF